MNTTNTITRNTTRMKTKFNTANEAYEYLHDKIILEGTPFGDTKALFNIGFYINDPQERRITNTERKWSEEYAEAEWKWYLSGSPSVKRLGEIYGKVPAIWDRMATGPSRLVNSNYGYQWKRANQLNNVIEMLKKNPETRQAAISIYDAKEMSKYSKDTPCTYAVQFTILNNKLDMSVVMRSNDLWYGFCNDQYQFSKLQEIVAEKIGREIGTYYHFAHNLHLYNDKL
jgi:thymidylate synthase